jgi:hypothetical protein
VLLELYCLEEEEEGFNLPTLRVQAPLPEGMRVQADGTKRDHWRIFRCSAAALIVSSNPSSSVPGVGAGIPC